MRFKDYYRILEIGESAPQDDIKKSYRRLAKKYHPDANPGNRSAEERFKEINEAYDVVGDAQKRRKYDQLRFYGRPDQGNSDWFSFDPEFLRSHGWPAGASAGQQQTPFGQFFGHGFAFSDILRDLFGSNGFTTGFEQPQVALRDIKGKIKISFSEAAHGTERIIAIRQKKVCAICQGTGQERFAPCMRCNGSGQILSKKKIRIRLPAGIENGHQLRLRGLGSENPHPKQAGDVLITVEVEPDGFFTRSGPDLYCEAAVEDQALKDGGRVRVPTLTGKEIELNIPAGTKKGTVFRLKSYGIKSSGRQGDQFVKIV